MAHGHFHIPPVIVFAVGCFINILVFGILLFRGYIKRFLYVSFGDRSFQHRPKLCTACIGAGADLIIAFRLIVLRVQQLSKEGGDALCQIAGVGRFFRDHLYGFSGLCVIGNRTFGAVV